MRVFITGATGYVGFNVACAFRRAGHEVLGLCRSEEKARLLARHEIRPVMGTLQAPQGFHPVAESCSVLVHCAADYQTDTFRLDQETVKGFLSLASHGARPKTLIYTSGVWVHGSTGDTLVDETAPLAAPKLVASRMETERWVLGAGDARGLVIRPGCVYGRQGGLTGMWFSGAHKDKALKAIGDGTNRWAVVHVDDLARAYVRAAESAHWSEAFNVTDGSHYTVREMVEAVGRAAGYRGAIEYVPVAEAAKTMGDFAECLALDQHVDGRKAERLLGWRPRHRSFVAECPTFFASWQAAQ